MQISVIIPTYKPDSTLYKCLDSLSKQALSLEEFEVVLILNGDKMPYDGEIQEYMSESPLHINYVYTAEKGVSNARNVGIGLARGEYITFIDSDDWVSESYLSGLLAETNGNQMALAKVMYFDDKRQAFFDNYFSTLYNSLCFGKKYKPLEIKSYFSVPVGKLLPARVCQKSLFSKRFSYGEDGLFMFSLAPALPLGVKAPASAIYFRRCREGSLAYAKRSRAEICKIHFSLLVEYWKAYLKSVHKYNFLFFINRNLAVLKHIILGS